MLIWQDVDGKAAVADRIRQTPGYDTSSGDSRWVRQYLEWCDPAKAVSADDDGGYTGASVPKVV